MKRAEKGGFLRPAQTPANRLLGAAQGDEYRLKSGGTILFAKVQDPGLQLVQLAGDRSGRLLGGGTGFAAQLADPAIDIAEQVGAGVAAIGAICAGV